MTDEIDPLSATAVTDAGSANTATSPRVMHGATHVGERIGRFIIEQRLGAGAMGVVYAARDPELDRQVAIKLIRTGARIAGLEARLFREAQALARVAHPNVVVVHEVGRHGDQVYVAMELVRGMSLREWMEAPAGPHEVPEILRMLGDAGRGLAAAHAADLIHRDFKPDNVLIGEDGRARVTDFGLARAQGDEDDGVRTGTPVTSPLHEALTQTGMMVGTPVYASPEQLAGERVGPPTDQFAFCVTAFEALYGVRPFLGASMQELRMNVERGNVVDVGAKRARVPRRVHDAILRGLSPHPEQRFVSMNALLAELAPEPVRTSKRAWIAGGAAIAAAGITVGVVAVTRSGGEAPVAAAACADAAAPVTAVWNDQASAQLRTAFLETKSPHAETLYRSAAAWYTRYANELAAARQATCLRHGSNQPDDATRVASACLDVRLVRFKHSVEQHRTQPITARVQTFLGFMDPVATCLRDKFEVRRDKFDEVTQARLGILGVGQTFASGGQEQAFAQLDAMLAQADAFGYAPLRAELLLARAMFRGAQQDHRHAEADLRNALTVAESAADDRSKTQAAARIADYLMSRDQLDEAAHMIDQAVASLARFGPDVSVEVEVVFVRGRLAALRKQHAEAIELLEKSIALGDANMSQDGNAMDVLAKVYQEVGRTADADALRARRDARFAQAGAAIPGAQEQLRLLQLCAYEATDEIAKVYERCKSSIPEIVKLVGVGSRLYADAHAQLGDMLEILDRYREAFEVYEIAAKVYETSRDVAAGALARESAGRALLYVPDFAGALAQYEKALAAALTSDDARKRIPMIQAGLGRTLVGLGRFDEAIPKLEAALDGYARIDKLPPVAPAFARFSLAKARWARNVKADRADAVLDARLAQRGMRQYLEAVPPKGDPFVRLIAFTKRHLAEIEAWVASH